MPCYKPLLGLRNGTTEKGKPKYLICSMEDEALDNFPPQDVIQIPCGKCLGCRLQYSQDWCNRLLMEQKSNDSSYFFTVTYDDENSPKVIYDEDGDYVCLESLRKKDAQKFIKDLRRSFPQDHLRYYICGEYGSTTKRPHIHGIIFGLHLDDVEETRFKSVNNDVVLYSAKFEKIWGKGFAELGTVTPASCSYVSRYVMKKAFSDTNMDCDKYGIEREFNLMSRKPGIGRKFYDEHPDMFDNISYAMSTEKGSVNIYPSRYFKKLIELSGTDPDARRRRQSIGRFKRESQLQQNGLGYMEQLKAAEKVKADQIAIIKRNELKDR